MTFAKPRFYTNIHRFFPKSLWQIFWIKQLAFICMEMNFFFFLFKVCIQILSSGLCAFLKTGQYYSWILRILFAVYIFLWDINELLYIIYFNITFANVRKWILPWQWANVHFRQILEFICLRFNHIKSTPRNKVMANT